MYLNLQFYANLCLGIEVKLLSLDLAFFVVTGLGLGLGLGLVHAVLEPITKSDPVSLCRCLVVC